MDWKAKALEELRSNALVEEVPGQENQYLVTVTKAEGGVLRTLVRLDVANERYHYMNSGAHVLESVSELISSMAEHLDLEEAEIA